MKINFKGSFTVGEFFVNMLSIVGDTVVKVKKENGEVKFNGYLIEQADITIKFNIEGMDEPQLITVEHHEGIREILTYNVDNETEVITNNEDKSFYDESLIKLVKGEELNFPEFESLYKDEDLTEVVNKDFGDYISILSKHKEEFYVERIYHKGKLIQEIKYFK